MKLNIFNKLKSMGLFFKITIANTIITSIILFIVSSIVISSFSTAAIEREISLGKEASTKLHGFVETKYNLAYNLSNLMHSNENIGEYLASIDKNPDLAYDYEIIQYIDNYLLSVISSDSDVSEYVLVSNNLSVYSSSSSNSRVVSPSFSYLEYPPIQKLLQSENNMYIYYDSSPKYISRANPVVSFAGKIYDPTVFPNKSIVGIYIMNIPIEYFESSYLDSSQYLKGSFIISNKQDEIVYSSNPKHYQNTMTELLASYEKDSDFDITAINVGVSGLTVMNAVSKADLHTDVNLIRLQMMILLVISISAIAFITYRLLRMYNQKITSIANKISNISGDNLDLRLPVQSSDEIGLLSGAFNTMCEQLDNYIKLNYESEMKTKTSEINALQAQINPHFLFNTIESIRMKAVADGNSDLAQMLSLLGNMFRWKITFNNKIVFLEDEIDYISSYLKLQSFRFNDIITTEFNISDELMGLGVPKLVLQPIVENSIVHGLDNITQGGNVTISAQTKDGQLILSVEDNGCGMEHSKVVQLNAFLDDMESDFSTESIGIKNVHERIRLLFGDKYGLTVKSKKDCGTTVIVTLPVLKKW